MKNSPFLSKLGKRVIALELRKGVHLMRVVTAVLTVLALLCLPTVAWADMSVGLD